MSVRYIISENKFHVNTQELLHFIETDQERSPVPSWVEICPVIPDIKHMQTDRRRDTADMMYVCRRYGIQRYFDAQNHQ